MRYAFGLFSIIPVKPFDVDRRVATRAMAAFPWMGLLLGAVAGGLLFGAWHLAGPLLGAMLALGLLAWLTGAIHLDGVADTADGLGSRRSPEEALTIMRKSDVGPMGVAALVLVLLIQAAALASMPTAQVAVVGVAGAAAVGRLAVTLATTSQRSARQQGFGALFVGVTGYGAVTVNTLAVMAVLLAAAYWAGGYHDVLATGIALAACALVGAIWARRLLRRLGGWTGDTFGSLIEVTQTVFLVAVALAS
ncbi:MAG: adenosylcobinamide-GDP ribazoletransferase [Propionibacteriaceae bacterium]|nr:adenosylcobinamide-GDP ribazoletransferase [Propionibacteriaceae bacterium]